MTPSLNITGYRCYNPPFQLSSSSFSLSATVLPHDCRGLPGPCEAAKSVAKHPRMPRNSF